MGHDAAGPHQGSFSVISQFRPECTKPMPPSTRVYQLWTNVSNMEVPVNRTANTDTSCPHSAYAERSIKVDVGTKYIQPHILCINDLIISKISRLSKVDQEDIELLSMHGECDLDAIADGVEVALSQTVGSIKHVRQNAD